MPAHWIYSIAALFAIAGVARIVFLFGWRRPIAARIYGTDLTEMQRCHDADMRRFAVADGLISEGDIPFRSVLARVAYDVGGQEYSTDVRLMLSKGSRPDGTVLIWYDPDNPVRATAFGLAHAAYPIVFGALVAGLRYFAFL